MEYLTATVDHSTQTNEKRDILAEVLVMSERGAEQVTGLSSVEWSDWPCVGHDAQVADNVSTGAGQSIRSWSGGHDDTPCQNCEGDSCCVG